MRYERAAMLLLIACLLLEGCQSGLGSLPVGRFTNQSDPGQVLELVLDPSQTSNPFIRISIETGANKYVGKSVGRYTLKTNEGSASGIFVLQVITFGDRKGVPAVWFTADNGAKWTLTVRPDGSMVDSKGTAWKRQTAA